MKWFTTAKFFLIDSIIKPKFDCNSEKKKKPYTVEPGNKELFGHQTVVH